MKNYINKIFGCAILASATLLASCGSDYLETKPTASVSSTEAVATTDMAYKALNGIARCQTTQHYAFSQGFAGENAIMRLYENLPSQNYNYNYYASGWAPIHNQTFHNRTSTIYDGYAWYYYYQLIGQANRIIAHIDAATGSDEDKKFIKASALSFRAYSYEKLIHYYCYRWQDSNNGASLGVVLRLDESTGDAPFATLAETVDQIYKDCQEAITLFGESGIDRPAREVWIPNANVAHAVYARAALFRQDYQTAVDQAKLAKQGYPLMSNDSYAAGFCEPTSEWIMGSYGDDSENNFYWSYGTQGACNGYYAKADGNPTGSGTIGHELISRIPNNDARKQNFLTEDKFPNLDLSKESKYYYTFGILGMMDDNIYEQADSIVKAHQAKGLTTPYQAGFYYLDANLKFYVKAQPGVGYVPFIRSSEMVLIEAEANYFLGKTAEAQAALVELNATSGRNPEYTCTKTGEELLSEIQDYRCLELWGEGFEWSDFKRWNKAVVRKSFAEGGNAHQSVAITIKPEDGNKWTWGVPLNETDYNADATAPKIN
ncbi:RagB/SusD family nutrient uptake outer membrane protein [Prevotella sp. AM23-5]|uniref:RagB/SusD family nutrient uptake outer membrane protein n=1 Tax=Prevotellaceae TaxID=171552 RepID=UPI000E52F26F|nr:MULTISPECIES: RagB/SusD family nutrient uptake outer membrane protein [Prevotellaceae]RHN98052.1 RagB/SusD family nutrient uptake outer membrane protein [Prevotella sp. AM23-5]